MSGGNLLAHEVPDFGRAYVGHAASDDRRAPGREFVKHAEVEISVECERERAWDGGCGHDQDVGLGGRGPWRGSRAPLGWTGKTARPHIRCVPAVGWFPPQLQALQPP